MSRNRTWPANSETLLCSPSCDSSFILPSLLIPSDCCPDSYSSGSLRVVSGPEVTWELDRNANWGALSHLLNQRCWSGAQKSVVLRNLPRDSDVFFKVWEPLFYRHHFLVFLDSFNTTTCIPKYCPLFLPSFKTYCVFYASFNLKVSPSTLSFLFICLIRNPGCVICNLSRGLDFADARHGFESEYMNLLMNT